MFEEAMAEDQATLEARLEALRGKTRKVDPTSMSPADKDVKPKPLRQALPEHLQYVVLSITTRPTALTTRLSPAAKPWCASRRGACRVLRAPSRARQVGLQMLPDLGLLLVRVTVSRFVDHLSYFRQEQINARSHVVAMLDSGAGKTKRAHMWAYARGAFDPVPRVAYDFRASRAARHPVEFLKG